MKILELSAAGAGKEDKSRRDHLRGSRKGVPWRRSQKEDQKIRAYLTVDEEKVLERAKEVDNGIRSGKYTQARWQVSRSQ
ncbi:MAG: hypothetical protein ACLVEO_03355 [Lachnospiraceae bacterium]